jgi:chloride channel 3/4/5
MGGTELVYNLFAECKPGNSHEGLCIADPGSLAAIWPVARAIGVAMIVKAALTVVTFGVKLPAGIFIPTLGVGACAGRILGIAMQWFQYRYPDTILLRSCGGDLNCKLFLLSWCYCRLRIHLGIVPGLYAMIGAAAALSGVTVSATLVKGLPTAI